MNQRSSIDVDSATAHSGDVPLSERPLLEDDQKTVVSTGNQDGTKSDLVSQEVELSAQAIRDRLFARPGETQIGERDLLLGHFRVEEQVGSGGMGAVFRAVDLELSRDVALKVLNPVTSADPALVARFRNEARACAQLNHDNIARVYYAGQQAGVHFIAYEYATGRTIRQLISTHGRLPEEETLNYAIQTTLALGHINAAGVVHRDIKPSNIILTDHGRIKVVDLGLARRDSEDSFGDLTVAGTMLGTFDYVAPEQARDPRTADIRSDLYSLGCTVYHMLTGQPPYPEGTGMQKLLDHQGKSPPDVRSVTSNISLEFAAIVQKMMNTDPNLRYQEPGQLLVDLTSLATRVGLRTVPAEGVVWKRVPVRRVRELSGSIFVAGAVLAICVAALTMHFFPGGQANLEDAQFRRWKESTAVANLQEAQEEKQSSQPPDQNVESPGEATAGADSTESVSNLPPEPPAVDKKPFLLVAANGDRDSFESLQQALDEVRSGGEIVLDFDGSLGRPVPCLPRLRSVDSRVVTIRAAAGRRPVLEFEGDESGDGSGSTTPGRLFSLSNGLRLNFEGIHLKVNVRGDVQSDNWMLFELNGPGHLGIRDCIVDVLNPMRGQNASVVEMTEPRTAFADTEPTTIELRNVIVRGGCDVVRVAAQTSGRIDIQQSLLATDGAIIRNLGSAYAGLQGRIDCELEYVTSLSNQPAFILEESELLNDGEAPERTIPVLEVTSRSCVYASFADQAVLTLSQGNSYVEESEEFFLWRGSHNYYYNMSTYWLIKRSSETGVQSDYSFEQWVSRWTLITAAEEKDAVEAASDLWRDPIAIESVTNADLTAISPSILQIDRSLFFVDSPPYTIDEASQLPGVDLNSLPSIDVPL